ncbi:MULTISPECIES: DNA-binding response regulator [Luteococcus]|uniref:Two component transcriptional regulator, LuxR family n=1 Tax=Luteococcus japonicus LSP_Lj1 TaxID=1255658 RepID=A0A1R4K9N9_9ACTN|nr:MULTISPECIES: response regulator [Luteococcus]MDN5563703.1 response regulator [Luteococcus sp.]SJN41020.1 Two component transcriptional regulator, LuxR family [Luteococcus japonicus LSP_Lj1]
MNTSPLRLAALDDHPVVLAGLQAIEQASSGGLAIVHSVTEPEELFRRVAEEPVDVALVDLQLKDGLKGPEVVAQLDEMGIPSVVYTAELRPMPIRRAVAAGALGLALKNDPLDGLIRTIQSAAAREFAVSSQLADVLIKGPSLTPRLAPREIEALELLHQGIPRKSVGRLMNPPASDSTVDTYLRRVSSKYRMLGRTVHGVPDALSHAERDGYFEG